MQSRENLIEAYDDARVEHDRAHLEAWLTRRRVRLAELPGDVQKTMETKARIRATEREVRRTENACKVAGWALLRPPATAYLARHRGRLERVA